MELTGFRHAWSFRVTWRREAELDPFRYCCEATVRDKAPPPPVAKLIGIDLISVRPGEAVVELQAADAHANPMGTLHGGILCDIADAAMDIAYNCFRFISVQMLVIKLLLIHQSKKSLTQFRICRFPEWHSSNRLFFPIWPHAL
jgi:hypothetical protein